MPSPGYIPGPLVIPNTAQVRLIWTNANGKLATNVLHCLIPAELVVAQAQADAIMLAISGLTEGAAYFALLSADASLIAVGIRDLRVRDQVEYISSGAAILGTGSGDALPEEVALVVTLRSAFAGRAHRGRVYLTGWATDALAASGAATDAAVTATNDWMNALATALHANSYSLGIGHRGHAEYTNHLGNLVPAEAAGTDLVTVLSVRDKLFDSQRRRK